MTGFRRRDLLAGTAIALLGRRATHAGIISGRLPWTPDAGSPPLPVRPGPWQFFTAVEAASVEAIADRMIPPDPQTPGGRDAGCAVFIDRQLAGPYGRSEGLYDAGPFLQGVEQQGPQSPLTPSQMYRSALAALERHCRGGAAAESEAAPAGSAFAALASAQQDALLTAMEGGSLELDGVDTKQFFEKLLKDVQQGFFADPIYGGNRDMCSWKMIGFPGARYDYRDWVGRHNERYPRPPVSLLGRAEWTPRR